MKNKNCNKYYLFIFLLLSFQSLIGQGSDSFNPMKLNFASSIYTAGNDFTEIGDYDPFNGDHSLDNDQEGTSKNNDFNYLNSIILMPTATLSVDNDQACLNGPEPILTFTGANGTPPYTFVYTVDGAMTFTDQIMTSGTSSSVTLNHPTDVEGATTYQIVEVQDGSGSSSAVFDPPLDVIINGIPNGFLEVNNAVSCVNGDQPEIVFIGEGSGPFTFVYNIDGGAENTISTSGGMNEVSLLHPTSSPGVFMYNLTLIEDDNGCTNEIDGQTVSVIIEEVPSASFEVDNANVCLDDQSPLITVTGEGGTSPYIFTYTINGGNEIDLDSSPGDPNAEKIVVPTDMEGTLNYKLVKVTDDNGCETNLDLSLSIVVNPLPEVTMPSSNETFDYCEGDNAPDISFSFDGVAPFEIAYTDGVNTFVASGVNSVYEINNPAPGEYAITSVIDDNGCSTPSGFVSNSITVIENPLPLLEFINSECSMDLLTYDIEFNSDGTVTSTEGTVSGNMVIGIPAGTDVILTAISSDECELTLDITAPDCGCNSGDVELPESDGDQSICDGDSNPTLSVTIGPGLSANWYLNSPSGGTILPGGEETLTYTPSVTTPDVYNYYVEGYDPLTGCVSSMRTLVVFTIYDLPTATLDQEDPVCVNDLAFDLTGSPLGGVYSGSGITNSMDGTFDPAIAGVGAHTIVYTVTDSNSCTNTDSKVIIVNSIPTLELVQTECSANLLTYDLEFNSNGTVTSTEGTVTGNMVVGIPANTDVVLTAESNTGCEVDINVAAPECDCESLPPPTNNGDQSVCEGEINPSLSVNVSAGFSANWYTQATGGSILPNGEQTLTYISDETMPGTYAFYAETVDPTNGCVSEVRTLIELTIFALPEVTLDQEGPFCIDEPTINLTGLPSGGEFTGNGIVNSVVGTFDPAIAGEGIHTITYSYTDANSCTNSETIDIIVNLLPEVSIENVDPICINEEPITLQGSPTGTSGEFSGDGIIDALNGIFDPAMAGQGIHSITYTYTDNNSCENSASIEIEVVSLADFFVNSAACTSDLLTYTIEFSSNATSIESTAGNVDLVQNLITDIPADLDVILTIISEDNCNYTIEISAPDCDCEPEPEPVSNGDEEICFGEPNPELSVTTASSEISANWYAQAAGGTPLNGNTPSLTYTPDVTLPGAYIYYVEAINLNSSCISSTRTPIVFTIYSLPTPNIIPENPVFCDNSSIILNAGPFESFLWSDNSTNQALEVSIEGNYSVTVTDENQCTGTDEVSVSSAPSPFVSSPNNDIEIEYCENDIAPNIEFALDGIGPFEAQYSFNGGPPQDGIIVNDKLIIFEAEPGTYEVVSISDNSCVTADSYISNSVTVIENAVPEFSIIKEPINNDLVCNGSDFILSTDLDDPELIYNWSTPVGAFSSETLDFENITPSYDGTYFLTVTTNSLTQCSFTASKEINVSTVDGTITTNTGINKICSGETITLIAEGVPSDNGVTWLNGIPSGQENDITVEVTPTETTTYDAILRNNEGCERNASYTIVVNPLPDPVIVSDISQYCSGTAVTLSTEELYSEYSWSNNGTSPSIIFIANTTDTNYQVTVTDQNNCTNTDAIELQVTTSPITEIFTETTNLPAGATADFEAINSTTAAECNIISYEWYVDGTFIETTSGPNFSYAFTEEGDVEVCVVLLDDCSCTSELSCQDIVVFENGQCIVSFKPLDNLCLDQESTLVANPVPGTADGANIPEEGYFIVENIDINQDFKDNFLNVEVGDPGRRFIVRKVLFKDKPFSNADKFLDSIIVEFKNPVKYNYRFYYDFGLCVKTSSFREADVQQTPEILDVIIDDEACFGESPILSFEIASDQPNFKLRYEVNGEAFEKDFIGNNNSIQLGPQTNPNVDLEVNLIELINFKDGEVIQATGCSSNDIEPSNIIIDVLPDVEYTVQDSCDEDGLNVQYFLEFEGGTGNYSIDGIDITGNTFESPFIESGQSQTYNLVDEGCDEENSDLITLSSDCETCILFESIVEEQNIIVDGEKDVCSSDIVTFSLDKAPDISPNQIIVYAVLSEPSQFYDEEILILDSITSDPSIFQFDINSHPSFEAGLDYFVTAFVFFKQASGFKSDPTCPGLNPVRVTFYETPSAEIENLENDLNICLNEFDYQVGIDNNVTSSTLSSSNSDVNITYIEGDTRALISIGDISANEITVSLDQSNIYNLATEQLTCSASSNLVLNVLDRQAPVKDTIISWPGFMYSFVAEGYCYQWGLNDDTIEGETDRFYILGQELGEDDVLWINIWDCDDAFMECVSTIYYNATEPPKFEIEPDEEIVFQIFPNPNDGQFILEIEGLQIGSFEVKVINSTGQLVKTIAFDKMNFKHEEFIQMNDLSPGLYILEVQGQNGETTFIKFLKQ